MLHCSNVILLNNVEERFNNYQYSAGNYMFKVNNGNTRKRCEICSKLTIKTREQHRASKFWLCIDSGYEQDAWKNGLIYSIYKSGGNENPEITEN